MSIEVNEHGGKSSALGARYDLIPMHALREVARVLHHGEQKYGADNWRLLSVQENLNHALGHLVVFQASFQKAGLDGPSALVELSHAATRCLMALDTLIVGQAGVDEPTAGRIIFGGRTRGYE